MASKAKPTGNRRSSTRAKKPATIDLDAKEVKAEATQAAKASSTTAKSEAAPKFGRPQSETTAASKAPEKVSEKEQPKPDAKLDTKKEPAKPEPASAPKTTPAPQKSSGSFFSKLTSALMGGTAALVGFGAIGLWDGARELPIIGNFYGGAQSATVSSEDLNALKAEIAALKENNSSANIDLSPINEKLASLEASVSQISQSAGGTSEISEKLAQLEQEFGAVNTSLAEITASAADGRNTSPVALSTAISALDQRLETIEAETDTIAKSVLKNPTLDALSSSINSIEQELDGISGSVSELTQTTKANSKTLEGLTAQSETLEDTVASVRASEKVARSVAVNALGTALENGDPLSLPISSVKALIGETPETARLEELNSAGIPTQAALLSSLESVINTVQNPNTPSKDGSITERFWANAQNMVTFRSSGPQEGDTPLAILSRVKAKVEAGELAAAKAEWETMPQDIRDNGKNWLSSLNTRLEAFALHGALNQKLTAEAG